MWLRTNGGVSANIINNDSVFARNRENGLEFGHSASRGKTLRRTAIDFMADVKDKRFPSGLTKVMS